MGKTMATATSMGAAAAVGKGPGRMVPAELRDGAGSSVSRGAGRGRGFLGLLAMGSGEIAAYPTKMYQGKAPVAWSLYDHAVGGVSTGPKRASCKW